LSIAISLHLERGKIVVVYCECGCGQLTNISAYTNVRWGWVKGQPRRYLRGHTRIGKPQSAAEKAKKSDALKGRPHTAEQRRKWRAAVIGQRRPSVAGANNHNWKGGVSNPRYNMDIVRWRRAVKTRDNFACQSCGKTTGYIDAHHIKPYKAHPELRFDVTNGLTLCRRCHAQTERALVSH
jgi:5-methylcytosine-specific restriction endonuclease McrA